MRRFLVSALASYGFRSLHMGTHAPTIASAVRNEPDLILVDVGRSSAEAVSLATRLRESTPAPILVLLELPRERDGADLLDAGANDYVVKPFAAADLVARMRVWLRQAARARRPSMQPPQPLHRLRIDRERRSLVVDGREVHLTPTECTLLVALSRSRGAMSEEQIVAAVWGMEAPPQAQQHLRTRVRQLRNKLERDPMRPRHLVDEAGGGYRLKLG
jgi:two-component system KDP operon response regulator KdpE